MDPTPLTVRGEVRVCDREPEAHCGFGGGFEHCQLGTGGDKPFGQALEQGLSEIEHDLASLLGMVRGSRVARLGSEARVAHSGRRDRLPSDADHNALPGNRHPDPVGADSLFRNCSV